MLLLLVLPAGKANAQNNEFKRLTNLPHLYINTYSGQDVNDKKKEVDARLYLVDEDNVLTTYDPVKIRGRGNSTWGLEKKPYRVKFDEKKRFGGSDRANAKKWTLLANHADKTLMRNALAAYIGTLCGQPFTPAARFVDLTQNGKYLGTYQISDQIDIRKRRVDIKEQDYPLKQNSNITGGYLLEADGFMDYEDGKTGWRTADKHVPITIHYPDEDEINNDQFEYIKKVVNRFEYQLMRNDYHAYADTASIISWYLANEIAANPDYIWSMYFYKEQDDDRLVFGPIWDFDIAFDNDNRVEGSGRDPRRQLLVEGVAFTNYGLEDWVNQFWRDEWFQRSVYDHYSALYNDGLEQKLLDKIDELAALLDESQKLNFERWNISQQVLREQILFNSYDEAVEDLRNFIRVRVPALLKNFAQRHPDKPDVASNIDPDFIPAKDHYYTFENIGTQTIIDIDNNQIVCNAGDDNKLSQQWQIKLLGNGYHQIINRLTGLALTDPTEGASTANTNLGAQLTMATANEKDLAQQWNIVKQGEDRYNLINRKSEHTANLSGGNPDDGTPIQSYTTDNRNGESANRQWKINQSEIIISDINDVYLPDIEYALAYDSQNCRLHFGSDDLSLMSFTAAVYDMSGRRVLDFKASEGANVQNLPKGIYLVVWQLNGRSHSAKFQR